MKGTFFNNKLEFKIEIEGESWSQGSSLKGSLKINNHGNDTPDYSKYGCHLSICNHRKLKDKDIKGIKFLESSNIESGEQCHFDFKLNDNSPITDSLSGPYIFCGDKNNPFEGGMLEIKVTPIDSIVSFLEVLGLYFKFKLKSYRNKNNGIEAKIVPPDSKDWKAVQRMSLLLKMDGENLEVDFNFVIKKLSFIDSVTKTKDEKVDIKKTLSKKEYSLYGSANHEGMKKAISEVLDQVKLKPVI